MREEFADALSSSVRQPLGPARRLVLLLALRSDFEREARTLNGLDWCLTEGTLSVPTMTESEIRSAVEKPALAMGVRFDDGLVDRIVSDFTGQPGALPLLQFMLTVLWEEQEDHVLGANAYQEIGALSASLARYADDVYRSLDDSDQKRARRVLLQLTGLTHGSTDTRRPLARHETRTGDWDVVLVLARQRLLVVDHDESGEDVAELAHESLAQSWAMLRSWLDDAAARLAESDARADVIIRRFSLTAGAVNILPPPLDMLAVGSTFARMGQQMARAYDASLNREVLRTAGLAMAEGVAAVAGGVYVGNSLLKFVPGVNIWVALLVQPPLVGAIAYAVGNTWKYFFRVVSAGGKGPDNAELKELVSTNLRNNLRHLSGATARKTMRPRPLTRRKKRAST
jgi:uncharacterized protein (DUF697 family)